MELLKRRFAIAFLVPTLFFIAFSARLFYLQIYKGDVYRSFSEKNILRILELPAPRGRIFDRNGEKILFNKPSFNIQVFPREITNVDKLAGQLSELIDSPKEGLQNKLSKIAKKNSFHPVTIAKDISWEELLLLEKNKQALQGIFLELEPKRFYPYEEAVVLLGYTGSADINELKNLHIKSGSQVGKIGVEKAFDSELRGADGLKYIMVDAYGKAISDSLSESLPTNRKDKKMVYGKDLYLTIDIELQKVASEALGDENGAIVAMDVRSGEILAMVSHPFYIPEFISKKTSTQEQERRKKKESFLNRSTQATYPPGSVLKIITAFALLEEKIVNTRSSIHCPGYYFVNKKRFNCWRKEEGHGHVNLYKAIVESCDVFFYKFSLKLGVDRLYSYMKQFGLGKETGIVLAEKRGINPSTAWKKKHLKERWYPGETAILSIGQGYVTTTPLQISVITSAIANGGRIVKPKIRKTDKKILPFTTEEPQSFNKDSIIFLKKALHDAVNGHQGTGIYAKSSIVPVSGKTGTAQVVSAQVESTEKRFQDHAWFTSYAPSDSAEIAVTVLVENGGSGGLVAAPMAKKVIETYFRLKKERSEAQVAKSN